MYKVLEIRSIGKVRRVRDSYAIPTRVLGDLVGDAESLECIEDIHTYVLFRRRLYIA